MITLENHPRRNKLEEVLNDMIKIIDDVCECIFDSSDVKEICFY